MSASSILINQKSSRSCDNLNAAMELFECPATKSDSEKLVTDNSALIKVPSRSSSPSRDTELHLCGGPDEQCEKSACHLSYFHPHIQVPKGTLSDDYALGSSSGPQNPIFMMGSRGLCMLASLLPTATLGVCILVTILQDYKEYKKTHCKTKPDVVLNYLPSVSSSIGNFSPQKYLWRILIAVHAGAKLLLSFTYFKHYRYFCVEYRPGLYRSLVLLTAVCSFFENCCLLVVSYVSSVENLDVHEKSFGGFMVFSQLYMLLSCLIFKWSRSTAQLSQKDFKALCAKATLFSVNFLSLVASLYLYNRHNTYCEPGVYTIFAVVEYIVVISNAGFHAHFVLYDIRHAKLIVNIPVAVYEQRNSYLLT